MTKILQQITNYTEYPPNWHQKQQSLLANYYSHQQSLGNRKDGGSMHRMRVRGKQKRKRKENLGSGDSKYVSSILRAAQITRLPTSTLFQVSKLENDNDLMKKNSFAKRSKRKLGNKHRIDILFTPRCPSLSTLKFLKRFIYLAFQAPHYIP